MSVKMLPLFPSLPRSPLQDEVPLGRDTECMSCELARNHATRCIPTELVARPGGEALYVVGAAPTAYEHRAQRPFSSQVHKWMRREIERRWAGPVAYDNAIKCAPGEGGADEDKHIAPCRQYLAQAVVEVAPARILAVGPDAVRAVLGRALGVVGLRHFHGWCGPITRASRPDALVPVYVIPSPRFAIDNPFEARAVTEALDAALVAPARSFGEAGARILDLSDASTEELAQFDRDVRAATATGDYGLTFDVETSGKLFNTDFRVDCVAFQLVALGQDAPKSQRVFFFSRESIDRPEVASTLRALLEDAAVPKVGHNLSYDVLSVRADPRLHARVGEGARVDTRLWRKLLDGEVNARLDVAAERVGLGGQKEEGTEARARAQRELTALANEPTRAPLKSGKPRKPYVPASIAAAYPALDGVAEAVERIRGGADPVSYAYRYIPHDVKRRYNAKDVLSTTRLAETMAPELASNAGYTRVWSDVMLPASWALADMQARGIRVDRESLEAFCAYLRLQLEAVGAAFKPYPDVNFNSPAQLAALLFDRLKLPRFRRTESGADSTDAEALESLRDKHPLVAAILEHRRLSKLLGTYGDGLRAHIRDDGRIHTSFLLDGAGTGRLSSQDPNLQNIPRAKGSAEAKMLRRCFVPAPGLEFLEVDYSQIELRFAAAWAQDPVMLEAFARGEDLHLATTRKICKIAYGVSVEEFDRLWACPEGSPEKARADEMRSRTKAVNFGILYGKEAMGLAKEWGVAVSVAQGVINAVFGLFRVLAQRIARAQREGAREGGTFVPWDGQNGNWRPLPALGNPNTGRYDGVRQNALNSLTNTPIQGGAAHLLTASLYRVQQVLHAAGLRCWLLLTVHDSMLFEVHPDDRETAQELIDLVMTRYKLGVPLVVDFKHGPTWGDLK